MASFQVPQFIEEKPKIIGPLTLEQFLYVAAAAALSLIGFYILNFFFWILISVLLAAIAVALAFVKIGGRSLPLVIKSALDFFWQPRTYIWERAVKERSIDTSVFEKLRAEREKMGVREKIKSAALSITTGKPTPGEPKEPAPPSSDPGYQTVTFMTGEKKLAKKIDY